MKIMINRKGISLVALIVTIIVLIVLTTAIVLNGNNVPKNARLAVFFNDVTSIQEAINLKMINNLSKYADSGELKKYKWDGILKEYNPMNNEPNFDEKEETVNAIKVWQISEDIARVISIDKNELEKYFVSEDGVVYYYNNGNGFEVDSDVYYNRTTIKLDPDRPTVDITANTGDTTSEFTITYTITFNKGVINFTEDDIIVTNGVKGTFTKLTDNTYTIVVTNTNEGVQEITIADSVCTDVDGNNNLAGSKNVSIVLQENTDGSYNIRKGVNSPILADEMVAVYWNNNGDEISSNDPNFVYKDWYDYIVQESNTTSGGTSKWANAKTTDGSYWVWIPRFAYKITSGYQTRSTGTIDIDFVRNTTNLGSDGVTEYAITEDIEQAIVDTFMSYFVVNPAFRYTTNANETTEMPGFWMAKYEMSNQSGVAVSKPGKDSWRSISVTDIFNKALNYDTTSVNNAKLDSHMLKNEEWGAVAYLTHSKYGRNATEVSANLANYYTGGTSDATVHTNFLQSTTGNCYGIFDMNAGAYDYVAAYYTGASSYFANGRALVDADNKYKTALVAFKNTFGDAIYATFRWYNDWPSQYVADYPFMVRGGYIQDGEGISGIFDYTFYYAGHTNQFSSWRVSLWPTL